MIENVTAPSSPDLADVERLPDASPASVSDSTAKPYKGLDSFQIEDADFFYGRDREAEQVVAKILGARLTVLHAQSGAGKTSLLNARVIPSLESNGWTAVRTIPQNDPIQAVTRTALLHVLPPPLAERQALETAWIDLGTPDSIGALLDAYDALARDDARRRRLIGPVSVPMTLPWTGDAQVRAYPWFTRLLRTTVGLEQFSAHVTALRRLSGRRTGETIDAETPVSIVVQALTDLIPAYTGILEEFAATERTFNGFFGRLLDRYEVPDFALVVLFDQAEELFTRFVDQPSRLHQTANWRLKWQFFEQLEGLIGSPRPSATKLPVRFVVSLRSEYICQLDPVRSFTWDLDACSYHLGLLGKADALTAITQPAERFGYSYAPACYARMITELAREERYVEPAQLQIVCDKLWTVDGRRLAEAHRDGEGILEIGVDTLERLGYTPGILSSFLNEVVGELANEDRLQTLELLEPLVTRSGTRNVASRDQLVDSRFRDTAGRTRLLDRLVTNKIVREERRLGGMFVEITHEFLIEPVLTLLHQFALDADYSRFRWALGALQQLAETGQDARAVGTLRIGEFLALHDNRHRLVLDDWSREVMLRSAVSLLHILPDYREPREILTTWANEMAVVRRDASSLESIEQELLLGRRLWRTELQMLNAARDLVELTLPQLRVALASTLAAATDAERGDVEYWTREVMSHEQRRD